MNQKSSKLDQHGVQVWHQDQLPHDVESSVAVATVGYSTEDLACLRVISEASAHIRTLDAAQKACSQFQDLRSGRIFETLLRQLGPEGRSRLKPDGINQRHFVRAMIKFAVEIAPSDLEDVVRACVEYANASDPHPDLSQMLRHPEQSGDGRQLLAVLGFFVSP